MSWQDRQYASESNYRGSVHPVFRGSGMNAMSVVTKIIIANVIVYFLMYSTGMGQTIVNLFIMQANAVLHGQVWRLFTATYMHANFMHIFFNMLVLYFFGPLLERRWGGWQFFVVYTLGGVVGNVILTAAGLVNFIDPQILGLGASGSVMTIMAAGAAYYPRTEVLVYFILPLQLRTVVLIYGAGFVLNVIQKGHNFGGDLCHLSGLAVGYWWAMTGGWAWARGAYAPRVPGGGVSSLFKKFASSRPKTVSFRERVEQRRTDAATVDEILAKVYGKGINSLSSAEKKALNEATARLREHEKQTDSAFKR